MMTETILRFVLKGVHPFKLFQRFHPDGKRVLNRTEWRGRKPRTCCITRVHGSATSLESSLSSTVEVTFRPPGFISYLGNTRYDGWDALILDQAADGVLLDGHGKPLKEGDPPVYRPVKVYGDVDFNEIDFGEFVEEVERDDVKHVQHDVLLEEINRRIHHQGHFSFSMVSGFMAPRRNRPVAKIVVLDHQRQHQVIFPDAEIESLNRNEPHFTHVLYVRLLRLLTRFMQGEVSIKSMSDCEGGVYVELSDSLVDATQKDGGSRFNVLKEYLPEHFMDDLARQITSLFLVDVRVVDGEQPGLYILPQQREL